MVLQPQIEQNLTGKEAHAVQRKEKMIVPLANQFNKEHVKISGN